MGIDNATKNGANLYYEFEKINRIKVCNAVTEEKENHERSSRNYFLLIINQIRSSEF